MAYSSILFVSLLCSLLLLLLLVLHSCVAMGSKTDCQTVPHLFDMEPDIHIPNEAGSIQIWNPNNPHFQCAGVQVVKYTIQPNGLVLPYYFDADELSHIIQGNGVFGLKIPGCSQESDDKKNDCQQIHPFQTGDLVALRAGETLWSYNSGNETVIIIVLYRLTNIDHLRTFFLGGSQNILHGFSSKFISDAFNIDNELATKLQSKDLRGSIIYTGGGLHLSNPPTSQPSSRQQERKGLYDVVEESFCNINTRIAKISDPSNMDLFIPEVGHLTTINAHKLPVLESIQLSISYELLEKDVMRLPHWENNYKITYVLKGEGHVQVVDDNGKNVFDDVVKAGQILVIPPHLLVAKQGKSEIFEYIDFRTNANPVDSNLLGKSSIIHWIPLEVLTNAFRITEEDAKKMKFRREETTLAKIMPKIYEE
ncbi:11S globulin seed storage protein 1 [Euphorbia peplus]|nr:11S globulin seed storage protein 1 [Euphorbia peplus]